MTFPQLRRCLDNVLTDEFNNEVYRAFAAPSVSADDFSAEDIVIEPLLSDRCPWRKLNPVFVDPINAKDLTVPALLYVLPLYMLATLRYEWIAPGLLLDELYTPGLPSSSSDTAWWNRFRRWDQLIKKITPDQRRTIRRWMETIVECQLEFGRRDINEMFCNFWLYCSGDEDIALARESGNGAE